MVRSPLTFGRFMRPSTYQKVGKFNDECGVSSNLDFLIRVCLSRPKTRELAEVVYTYRRHPSSRTLGGQPDNMMDILHSTVSVAAFHLQHSLLRPDERSEMRSLHGRCSTRLAWMLMVHGQVHGSLVALRKAVIHNCLWPAQVIYWFGAYLLNSKRFS